MMHYIVLIMLAVIILLAWSLHNALGEVSELYEEIDELIEETGDLDRIAREERNRANRYQALLQEDAKGEAS